MVLTRRNYRGVITSSKLTQSFLWQKNKTNWLLFRDLQKSFSCRSIGRPVTQDILPVCGSVIFQFSCCGIPLLPRNLSKLNPIVLRAGHGVRELLLCLLAWSSGRALLIHWVAPLHAEVEYPIDCPQSYQLYTIQILEAVTKPATSNLMGQLSGGHISIHGWFKQFSIPRIQDFPIVYI